MLQPVVRSFGYYVLLGMQLANKKPQKEILALITELTIIDDAVIILDDIYDHSQQRNKNDCLYRTIGIEKAILESCIKTARANEIVITLLDKLKLNSDRKIQAIRSFNKFQIAVHRGQQIDMQLTDTTTYNYDQFSLYFGMIRTFTGGHVRSGIELGQLLANQDPKKELLEAAESVGIIRQIKDDFNDYFRDHHEPFGDFTQGNKRLPELLFLKNGGKRESILQLLKHGKYEEARNTILPPATRQEIHHLCKKEDRKREKLYPLFPKEALIPFDDILTR